MVDETNFTSCSEYEENVGQVNFVELEDLHPPPLNIPQPECENLQHPRVREVRLDMEDSGHQRRPSRA